uniref:Mitochondrial carrier protein n=1 Tax=Neobodo designis TaxID=312471 RepID=A0A7S1MJD7_NEODS|mmetsp:Transcript_41293/g.127578  ORF Transcript_41293/g.127578 Transcript_41293/m.127578 type:complete len:241 (+) Transcript_41293:47-769(+)
MSDFLSRGFNGSCVGTVSAVAGGLVGHPMAEFAARAETMRVTGISPFAFVQSTSVVSLVQDAPSKALSAAPYVGCSFALLEAVSYGALGLHERDNTVWVRFGKAAVGGCLGGVLEAGMASQAWLIPCTSLSRAVFFGVDAAVRPAVEAREREQQKTLWVPRLATSWYCAAVARIVSQPLWAICDAAHANNTSLVEARQGLMRRGGMQALYRGIGGNVVSAIGAAVTLTVYHLLRDQHPSM